MTEALKAGYEKLNNSDSSVEAVEAVIRVMEDSLLRNARKGASFTSTGTKRHECVSGSCSEKRVRGL
ncbi:MAG: isoaspartyl peptidase/L-asparaginase [bacterium]